MIPRFLLSPRHLGLGVAFALAFGWWIFLSYAVGSGLLRASHIQFRPNPPGMAAGPSVNEPPSILAANAWDGYIWVQHAQDMAARGAWRLKHTDFDNAPAGRGVHWNSGWAWWLIGLGWVDHKITGVPFENGIARMSMWASPISLVILFGGFVWLVARARGGLIAVFMAFAATGMPGFLEGFSAGYPDHHGLHNAAIAICVASLVLGGLGCVRFPDRDDSGLPILPTVREARFWFVLSGVAGACGLWVSAITLALCLVAVGIGAVAFLLWRRREPTWAGDVFRPELWRVWGLVGGGTSVALYLLEYFPSDVGLRLEVNHPLYALAWAGGGELLCRIWGWGAGVERTKARPRDWCWTGAAVLGVAALPVAILIGGAAWYGPFDRFLFDLHKQIGEFQPVWIRVQSMSVPGMLLYALGFPVCASGCVVIIWMRGASPWIRAAGVFLLVAGAAVTAAYLYQVRWGMAASGMWLAAAPLFGFVARLHSSRVWRVYLGVAGLAVAVFPVMSVRDAVRLLNAAPSQLERGQGFALLFRDIAQFLRASVGPEARVVLLSSPNTSTPTAYFGRFHGIGTLYWENRDGLAEAARLFNSEDDNALLRELTERGVTHVVYLNEEHFLFAYYKLQHPGGDEEGWKRTFGYRAFFEGKQPSWARLLPYVAPSWLKGLNQDVRILEVAPEQTVPEAYLNIAQYYVLHGNLEGAYVAILAAIKEAPQSTEARLKLAEILLRGGKVEDATRELRAVLPFVAEPDRARICFDLAALASQQSAPRLVEELLRETLRILPGHLPATNNLSWLLATSSDDSLRNGREALWLARQIVQASPDSPVYFATLGAALAETGDFVGAVAATRRAIALAEGSNRKDFAAAARERLAMFERGAPWRN